MRELTYQETAQWLQQCEDVCILIHRSPDGDCIGAGFALANILQQLGKRAAVVCEDAIPQRYGFLLPEDDVQPPSFTPKCVVAVDVADKKLLGHHTEETYGNQVDLCIDHHVSNVPYARNRCLNSSASATCEVLYAIFSQMPVTITDAVAACLYTGISTDTGCFQYDNVSAYTHHAVAQLMELCPDVPYAWINRKMFAVKSYGRLKLEQMLIDKLESHMDGKCMLICVTQEFMQKFALDDAQLEGIAGFPLQVEGAEVGVTMKEKETGVFRVSMRSADAVDVAAICSKLGGGGHVKAAGCQITGTLEEVKKRLLDAIAEGWNIR